MRTPSSDIDTLLQALQDELPRLRRDKNSFHAAFEERACRILALEETRRMVHRPMEKLQGAGLA